MTATRLRPACSEAASPMKRCCTAQVVMAISRPHDNQRNHGRSMNGRRPTAMAESRNVSVLRRWLNARRSHDGLLGLLVKKVRLRHINHQLHILIDRRPIMRTNAGNECVLPGFQIQVHF